MQSWSPEVYSQILLAMVSLSCCFVGWGWLASRTLTGWTRRSEASSGTLCLFDYGVLGVAVVYVLAVLLSLASRFSPALGDGVLAVGVAGYGCALVAGRKSIRNLAFHLVCLALLASFCAGVAMHAPLHYDTGLYHLPMVQWFQDEPVPLGLANVHVRFGFNSSWFVIGALLSASSLQPDPLFLINLALFVVIGGALVESGCRSITRGRTSFGDRFGLISIGLLMVMSGEVMFGWVGASPSTDLPAALFTVYALASAGVALEVRSERPPPAEAVEGRFVLAAIAAVLAVSVKMSQVATLAAVVYLAWEMRGRFQLRRLYIGGLAAVVAPALGWLLNGLMLSGCALFPAGWSCIGWLPWSADPLAASGVSRAIQRYARTPGLNTPEAETAWEWFPMWFEIMWPHRQFLGTLTLLSGCLLLAALGVGLLRKRRAGSIGPISAAVMCCATGFGGIAMTAVAGPDPRFCLGYLIAVPAALAGWILHGFPWGAVGWRAKVAAGLVLLLIVAPGARRLWRRSRHTRPTCCLWQRVPAPEFRMKTNQEGLTVAIPTKTDQCWLLEGPCSPEFHPTLRRTRMLGRKAFVR